MSGHPSPTEIRTYKEEEQSKGKEIKVIQRRSIINNRRLEIEDHKSFRASLTVEAALVMPFFLFAVLSFLYFTQIFTLQEFIQATITKMGLNMGKTAYVYEDFAGIEEALNYDETILGEELEIGLGDFAKSFVDQTILKIYARQYLDVDRVNHSCIQGGYDGISFYDSKILEEEDAIDIVVRYQVVLPIPLFYFEKMPMHQRVRVRAWTGYEVAATYSLEEDTKVTIVYITETGSVYHKSSVCSHIHLSVTEVKGIPTLQRNTYGGKYYPCEKCSKGELSPYANYYITADGTRYHTVRDCSKIKRNVKEIPLTEVGARPACKRCGQ
jgi:hypothetical protein